MALILTGQAKIVPASQAKVHVNGYIQAVYTSKGHRTVAIRDDVTFIDYIIPFIEGMYKGRRVTVEGYIRSTDAHSINLNTTLVELDLEV